MSQRTSTDRERRTTRSGRPGTTPSGTERWAAVPADVAPELHDGGEV